MALLTKIDSNVTGLRYAQEDSYKVVSGDETWIPLEPNSYDDFGGEISTVARNPINPTRQRKKGVTTDLDASGGFNMDLTQTNLQDILQGFFFADLRRKGEEAVTLVDVDGANPDEYEVASTAGFAVGYLIKGSGFTNAANNAMNLVTAVVNNVSVEVANGLLVAETPPAGAQITVVGVQGAAGDIDVDGAGTWPALTSTTLNFTTLGLVVGEFIWIGGDSASLRFVNSVNNGYARIRSIAANRLEFDKASGVMVTEASTTETIQLFFGRVLKNESDPTLIKRRTYQLERTLGAPDDAFPSQIQSEYLIGSVANEFQLNIAAADKITADLSFICADAEQRTGATGVKAGSRPALTEAAAFNTSSDVNRIRMAVLTVGNEFPTPLFGFVTELTVSINNNATPNKAVGVLGAFEVTAGTFEVEGSVTAYFSDVTGTQAVRNNADVTMDIHVAKENAGISIDLPLIALGDGRVTVEQDQPITLPLSLPAATGAKFNANMDHTMLMVFFDYLPTLAM